MTFDQERALDNEFVMHTYGRSQVEFVEGSGMTLKESNLRGRTGVNVVGVWDRGVFQLPQLSTVSFILVRMLTPRRPRSSAGTKAPL